MHVLLVICWTVLSRVDIHTFGHLQLPVRQSSDARTLVKQGHHATKVGEMELVRVSNSQTDTHVKIQSQEAFRVDITSNERRYLIHLSRGPGVSGQTRSSKLDLYRSTFRNLTNVRTKRTIVGHFPVCPRGCTACSLVNGCVTCERRLFMLLYRRKMRQIGICTASCPPGYYGVRYRQYSKCNKCQVANCQTCFSRHYCTRCYPPHVSHRGSCLETCPPGLYFANYSTECRETVDCLVGPWTPWIPCTPRAGIGCPQRRGVKVRSRSILESPSPNGIACPELEEQRACQVARACRDKCRRRKRHKRKRKRGRKRNRKRWKSRVRGARARGKKNVLQRRRRCRNGRSSKQRCRRRTRCPRTPG